MKKLLLILSAVFVSVSIRSALLDPNTGWDYLNPYAYDLKSEVINNGQTLRLTYKFNAPGFGNSDDYNNLNPKSGGTGRGIQIYLLYKNEQGEWQRVQKDDGEGDFGIYTGGFSEAKAYTVEVPVADLPKNCKGKELTWEARVHGNIGRTKPKIVGSVSNKPKNAYGIAINNCESHSRFAQMFVSEAYPSKRTGWNYWKDRWGNKQSEYEYANTMLEYTPLLGFQCAHHKHYHNGGELSHFASAWQKENSYTYSTSYNYEPNRVKISDDGRMFVSSFHPHANCVVLEYKSAYSYYNVIDNVWQNNIGAGDDKKPLFYKRCIGMDVKGSGENLQIVLCWIDANAIMYKHSNGTNYYKARIELWEYDLGKAEHDGYINSSRLYLSPFDTNCGYVRKIGTYDDWDYIGGDALGGLLYQGFYNEYNNASRGNVDVAYGTNNDVWVKIDYAYWKSAPAKIIRVNLSSPTVPTIKTVEVERSDAYYGGSGIFIQDNMLFTGTGGNAIHVYEINSSTGELVTNNNGSLKPKSDWKLEDERIGRWVTGFSSDHAGNLYVTTEDMTATTSINSYTANVLAIAMPYSTAVITRAKGTFTVSDPIPNILATDLRFAPVPKQPKYRFSFNVNTTPESAQIRFYKSYGDNGDNDMKKNLAKINADDYQGGNEITPSFVYNIPDTVLKQGEIAVEFDMVGGKVENGELKNTALPRGEWYWSVYVEAPRKSTAFAPIYKQGTTGNDEHLRLHATVNNYPETDGFGHIYAAQYNNTLSPLKKSLMVYGFNPKGESDDERSTINNSVRYKLLKEYINPTTGTNKFENQRRLAVAPDGKVFIADYGNTNNNTRPLSSVMPFKNGGIWLWDPAKQSESSNTINLSLFLNSTTETVNGLAIYKDYNDETKIKLYGTNTYGEFEYHGTYYTEAAQEVNGIFGKNGIKEYDLGTPDNINQKEIGTITRALGAGDGNGNVSIVTMEKGIWIAQHRLNDVQYALRQFTSGAEPNLALPDNPFNYILSFVPYNSSTRTWTSCVSNGVSFSSGNRTYEYKDDASVLTQKENSHLQSCPGAGLAYRKITAGSQKGEYLYIVNHEGNIVELQITSWNGNKPTVVYKKTLPSAGNKIDIPGTTRKTGAISTINFDYAGNLITTSGTEYLGDASQDIIVYTMPYDRKNAREIQAPNSCRFIPERTAYLEPRSEMELTLQQYIEGTPKPCYLDIFRPMPNTSFSTICLPFDLDMKQLTTEALKDAEVKQYKGLQLSDIGGEKMLELVFEDVPTEGGKQILKANTPYIIQPKVRIPGIIKLQMPIQFVAINEKQEEIKTQNEEYAITFKGVIPTQQIKVNQPLTLLLVAENRLAEMVPDAGTTGTIYGFRGYFELNKPLNGIGARITPKQSVSTSTTIIVDGKRVNIEKYLRKGRVYIRMGDTLYTIDGQKVQ